MNRSGKTVTVVALCGVDPTAQTVRINGKFHTGMLEYAKRLTQPLLCVLPRMTSDEASKSFDLVEIPTRELPYRIHAVSSENLTCRDIPALKQVVRGSALVYCGPSEPLNWSVAAICKAYGVPYAVTTECTLRTKLDIGRASASSVIRRVWGEVKTRFRYRKDRQLIAGAAEVHANGYPTYVEYRRTHPNTMLFFDSRILADHVVPREDVIHRVAEIQNNRRRPRLIYSGRYEAMKGVVDVVKAGIELHRRGYDFRLDLFGDGPLKNRMRELVEAYQAGQHIVVNDPIPFCPDLIDVTRRCDLFLCGHVQGDPSCTYLETFASGVPIVGYANEMWSRLSSESGGGVTVERGDHIALASSAWELLTDHERLTRMSLQARDFALQNHMEQAWDRRCSRIKAMVKDAPIIDS